MEVTCAACERGAHEQCEPAYDSEHDVHVRCYCDITGHTIEWKELS